MGKERDKQFNSFYTEANRILRKRESGDIIGYGQVECEVNGKKLVLYGTVEQKGLLEKWIKKV